MKNKWEILEIIDKYIDIENSNRIMGRSDPDWINKSTQLNAELKEKNLIGEYQNVYFSWGMDGKLSDMHLQLETRCLPDNAERFDDLDGNPVVIRRRDLDEIEDSEEWMRKSKFDFNSGEWANYKRTKLMDRILNETI